MPQAHLSTSIHSNETVDPDRLGETASKPVELFDDSAPVAEKPRIPLKIEPAATGKTEDLDLGDSCDDCVGDEG
jgi:hypothetical protein